jgi:hypothetical protein
MKPVGGPKSGRGRRQERLRGTAFRPFPISDYPSGDLRVSGDPRGRADGRDAARGRPVERLYWADNLRVLVIAAVVVFHTAMPRV